MSVPPEDPRADEAERRRRRTAVFGDAPPDTTADEREDGVAAEATSEEWLRAQVPPHHGT